ncbi:MAG: fibronectin type III domain-containing protein [Pelovirga sp.]
MKYIQVLIIIICILVNLSLPAFGREVTLYWEPSPSADVIGYKVYYQQGTPQVPLSGTEADQGSSPVDVENSLMATISGLQETAVYYFSVTAYDSNYNESSFSNIVSTAWMPPLRNPQKESIVVPWNVTFQWDAGPAEHGLNYILYYGSDQDQVVNAGAIPYSGSSYPTPSLPIPGQGVLIVSALLLLLTTWITTRKTGRYTACCSRTAVAGLFIATLAACGDGGGSGWSGDTASVSSAALTQVNTGSTTSYQADDLESGTTYYWKVEAHSTSEPGTVYHSEVSSFTTE